MSESSEVSEVLSRGLLKPYMQAVQQCARVGTRLSFVSKTEKVGSQYPAMTRIAIWVRLWYPRICEREWSGEVAWKPGGLQRKACAGERREQNVGVE